MKASYQVGTRVRVRALAGDLAGVIETAYDGRPGTAGTPTYWVRLDTAQRTFAVRDISRPRAPVTYDHVTAFEQDVEVR